MELLNAYTQRQKNNEIQKQDSTIENIDFFLNNVMNISEATRKNKLASVLEEFSTEKTEKVYIIQNSKKKEAAAVISSLHHYRTKEKLLRELQEEVLRLSKEVLILKTQNREQQSSLSLAEAIEKLELDENDLKDIFDHEDEVNID